MKNKITLRNVLATILHILLLYVLFFPEYTTTNSQRIDSSSDLVEFYNFGDDTVFT